MGKMTSLTVKESLEKLVSCFEPRLAKGYSRIAQYDVAPGEKTPGGKFYIEINDQKISLHEGEYPNPSFVMASDADTLSEVAKGEQAILVAVMSGKLKSTGDLNETQLWGNCFPGFG